MIGLSRAEPGAERARQPAQALDDIGPVGPEAHDLAESLVERAIGAIAKAAVLDDHQRHVRRRHPGHRPDGAEMMIGMEFDRARCGERFGGGEIGRPTFIEDGAGDGAAQRPAHLGPGDRRSRMQHHARAQTDDQLGRRADIDEHRLGFGHPAQRLAIGSLDDVQLRSSCAG